MDRPPRRSLGRPFARFALLIFAIGVVGVCAGGCTKFKLAYKMGPWMMRHKALQLANFNRDQQARIDSGVKTYFAWHRKNMLPEYGRYARKLALRTAGAPLTDAEAAAFVDEAQALFRRTLEPLTAPAAAIAASLDAPGAADSFARGLAASLEKARGKRQGKSRDDRRLAALNGAEEWLGPPIAGQLRERVLDLSDLWAEDAEMRLAARERWQAKLVKAARARAGAPAIEGILSDWVREALEGKRLPFAKALAQAWALLSPDQRTRLRQRLESVAGECEDLAREG